MLQSTAITTMLFTRPTRSARSEIGQVRRPTISATMPDRRPSCPSDRLHSALRSGNTAFSTWRAMKSEINRPKVSANTSQA